MPETTTLRLCRAYLGQTVEVMIDRPLGSRHPEHGFLYAVNYGCVPGTIAADGEALDAYYLGVDRPLVRALGRVIALIHRLTDDDDKLVLVPVEHDGLSDAEIEGAVTFQERWFAHEILR